ncbi:hypothetical protein DICVIV_11258 [Dictyocaulus viviparus]|uniref:Nose resistant-to-fluoxetine protein N-terminal domain-containing protein n=1 Tax=Dictyocaulus viviparus TaxID=29172 RepID=A0A0D8XDQ0_DICVI|nr:hypothetical protein DICVIV_11258 [Dictyocaulus viviparus]
MFFFYQSLLTILPLLHAISDYSKNFVNLNDSNSLLARGVSLKCALDMKIFVHSLLEFYSTTKSCAMNGGCDAEQKSILKKNMFAVKQIDSFGKIPPGILELTVVSSGSFVECNELRGPYPTHYCYARIHLKNMDIPMLMDSIVKQELVPLEFPDAACVPTSVQGTSSFWIFIGLISFLAVWIVLATIADWCMEINDVKKRSSKAMKVFLAFSFYSNSGVILDVRPPKKGVLKSLASIRFISMTWVAAGHAIALACQSETLLPVYSAWNPLLSTTFTNAFFSVDTFFLLSGILVSYLFFKSRPPLKHIQNPTTWVLFYVHRYLRLTPPIMMFIWFYTVILPFNQGPWTVALSSEERFATQHNVELCQKYWWRNLFYINNFFDNDEVC